MGFLQLMGALTLELLDTHAPQSQSLDDARAYRIRQGIEELLDDASVWPSEGGGTAISNAMRQAKDVLKGAMARVDSPPASGRKRKRR